MTSREQEQLMVICKLVLQLVLFLSIPFLYFRDNVNCTVRDGVQYCVNLLLSDKNRVLFIRLVDCITMELVRYDTTTGRSTFPNCAEDKICGNKNETVTIHLIPNTFKSFMKCN